jgi:hypothetical protein
MRMSEMTTMQAQMPTSDAQEQVRNAIDQPTRVALLVWEELPDTTHFYMFTDEEDIERCINAHGLFVNADSNTEDEDARVSHVYAMLEHRNHCKLDDSAPMCIPCDNTIVIVCYAGFCT